ncbi:hypothetical protein Vadar_013112 [Vaccinium darrowii]|uniref:Uncharacterized protein n=1 Tax=Vaccinium darrowii TaxID=229202 RepID=A0ACB7Z3F2_9ERIC|nr:hypothetical protein Vadar_013112 [Vaccinium darrowii]
MNEQIANDEETVKGLIFALSRSNWRKTSIAACNVVLDMATTSFGRQRLVESSFLEYLIRIVRNWLGQRAEFPAGFRTLEPDAGRATYPIRAPYPIRTLGEAMVSRHSKASALLYNDEDGSEGRLRIGFEEDELPVLLLDAAITLINSCSTEKLEKIPKKLSESLLADLKKLWAEVRSQMLTGTTTILKRSQDRRFCVCNFSTKNLAESIFRLSIGVDQLTTPSNMDVVKRCIFGRDGSGFENFILKDWEVSPVLIGKFSTALNECTDIFSSFRQSLDFNVAVPSFLLTILESLVSCPPIASDELDILCFLKELKSHLGCPMIYKQDIRVGMATGRVGAGFDDPCPDPKIP